MHLTFAPGGAMLLVKAVADPVDMSAVVIKPLPAATGPVKKE